MNKDSPKSYYEKHKDNWYEKVKCDICDGSYSRSSRYNHMKTKKHQNALKYRKIGEKLDIEDVNIIKMEELEQKLHEMSKTLKDFADSVNIKT